MGETGRGPTLAPWHQYLVFNKIPGDRRAQLFALLSGPLEVRALWSHLSPPKPNICLLDVGAEERLVK